MQLLLENKRQQLLDGQVFQNSQGLTVIHQHLATSPVTVVDVWVRAGSKKEPEEWLGMAHFLEHMVFKGSRRIAPGELDYRVESHGGMTNAATSHDYAHFFLSTATEHLPQTLPYLAEILLQAEIPESEFYCEREVVLEEIRYSWDDPDWIGFQALCENLYQNHPYRRSILGEESTLLEHTPNQMRCFHKTHYQPENMTVVVVGGLERQKALSLVNDCFADFSIRSECPGKQPEAEAPIIGIRRSEIYLPRIEKARLSLGWLGPGIESWQDAFTLDLISVILAGSRCSRLIRELREEKQLVLDILSDYSVQEDSSLMTISAWLEAADVERVEEEIIQQIASLQQGLVKETELNLAKRILLNDYIFSTETPAQLAGLYGYYQTIATVELSVAYPREIAKIKPQDIQRVAQQYLSSNHYAVTVLYPQ